MPPIKMGSLSIGPPVRYALSQPHAYFFHTTGCGFSPGTHYLLVIRKSDGTRLQQRPVAELDLTKDCIGPDENKDGNADGIDMGTYFPEAGTYFMEMIKISNTGKESGIASNTVELVVP